MELSQRPGLEPRTTARLQQRYQMFVDGRFVDGAGEPLTPVNPATEQVLAEVSTASRTDVDTAVRAARRAYDKVWPKMPAAERGRYLFRIARLIQNRARELAELESMQSGTPVRQCRDVDIPAAAAHFFHHAGWADKLSYAGFGPDPRPLGVAGQISSADAAMLIAAWKVAPALACGNTVVLKPAESAPLTALALADICQQIDLPPGVLNVLPGAGDVGANLAGHGGLDMLSFTGSTDVGKQVQRAAAGTGRRLGLALGGPASILVFEDAPVEQTVDGIVTAAFGPVWAGCRLLVQESIADQLLTALRARVSALRVGDPLAERTDIGPVGSSARLEHIRGCVEDAQHSGGTQRWTSPVALPEAGFFVAPTIVITPTPEMRISREELLGPVVPVLTFRTPDEALTLANNASAALSVSIWTGRGALLRWAARHLRAGVLWGNMAHRVDPSAPYGGYRESGLGREGGRVGLEAYLDV